MRTVRQIAALAADIGIRNIHLAGNKAASDADRRFFEENAGDIPLAGCLNVSDEAMTADRSGKVLYDLAPGLADQIGSIAKRLEALAKSV